MTFDPVSVDCDASIAEAARLMRDHDIGILPVTREGACVGVITDRDIIVRAIAVGAFVQRVASVATHGAVMLQADDDEDQAAALMSQYDVRRLPVVQDGKVVGIVSVGDIATRAAPWLAGATIKHTGPGDGAEARRGSSDENDGRPRYDEVEIAAARLEAFMRNVTVTFEPREQWNERTPSPTS
jgi:CBS-domain-containing membrane protein